MCKADCEMYPEYCRGGQHCVACDAIDPSQTATANYSRRYLTSAVPQGRLGNPQTGCQFGRVVDFALRAFRASSEDASIQSRNLAGAMLKTRLPAMAFLTWPAQFSSASITACRAAAILALDSRGRDETVAIESLGHQLLDFWRTAVQLVRQLFRERPLGHIRLVEETLP